MRRMGFTLGLLSLFASFSSPASAGCVRCGLGGDVSKGFSENCACIIRSRHGVTIWTPSGVCDPNQANTCEEDNNPWVNALSGQEISPKFLSRVGEVHPLLAGALTGAITEEVSRKGIVVDRWLLPGEHTGTMGKGRVSYNYTVQVRQIAANAFSVAVLIEEDGTSTVEEFEGVILEKGKSGFLDRTGKSGRSRVIAWNARDGEDAALRSN